MKEGKNWYEKYVNFGLENNEQKTISPSSYSAPVLSTKKLLIIFFAAWFGWGLDVFDAQLFNFVAFNCIPTLLGLEIGTPEAQSQTLYWTGITSSLLLIGWAIGGISFGYIADIVGRKLTMQITIILFAFSTAFCAFSLNIYMLLFFRFLAALGIGGEWAAGALLVAESVPENKRIIGGVLLFTSSPFGLFFASIVNYSIAGIVMADHPTISWRIIFLFGILPAIVASLIRFYVEEPDRWSRLNSSPSSSYNTFNNDENNFNKNDNNNNNFEGEDKESVSLLSNNDNNYNNNYDNNENERKKSSLKTLLRKYPRETMSGLIPSVIATIVWWCVTSFAAIIAAELSRAYATSKSTENWSLITTASFNFGSLIGVLFTYPVAVYLGRKPLYFIYFLGSSISIFFTFYVIDLHSSYFPLPYSFSLYFLIGFFVSGIFGSFTFYLPELFPTYLRGIGAGFCYNFGRFFAAIGPVLVGYFSSTGRSYHTSITVMFYVGFLPLIGCIASFFLIETKSRSLQD